MRRIGLVSSTFEKDEDEIPCNGNKKNLVKLLVNMITATGLQGCGSDDASGTNSTSFSSEDDGCGTTRMMLYVTIGVIIVMRIVMARMFWKLTLKMEEVANYRNTVNSIREVMR